MRALLIFCMSVVISTVSFSQTVTVTESEKVVQKITRTGLGILVKLPAKEVEKAWKNQLKEFGKVETSGKDYIVNVANVSSVSSRTVRIVSKIESTGKGTLIWWAIDLGDKWVKSGGTGYNSAADILKKFGKKCYLDDIQDQIDDAEKNLEKTVKEQEKTVRAGENLQGDLVNNGKEKETLEKKLVDNKEEKVQVEKDIDLNKTDQANMVTKVDEAKKAVEVVKKKLQGVK